MSDSNSKSDGNTNKSANNRTNKPEIQRYSVSKGKYSSRLNAERPSSGTKTKDFNSMTLVFQGNSNQKKQQYYQNDSSYYYYDDGYYNYQQRPQRKQQKTKPVENQSRKNEASADVKDESTSETELVRFKQNKNRFVIIQYFSFLGSKQRY